MWESSPELCLGCEVSGVQRWCHSCAACGTAQPLSLIALLGFYCVLLAVSYKLVTPCPVNDFSTGSGPAYPSESNGEKAEAAPQVVAGGDRTVEIQFSLSP